ncbi:MAG: NADPH-dependent FMN reductase [Patescibacteria group bacterium]
MLDTAFRKHTLLVVSHTYSNIYMSDLFIPVIQGTTRPKRKSIHVSRLISQVVQDEVSGVSTELVDPNDFTLPHDGNDPENKDPRYSEITKKADGFIIVVPEYNHSFPGSLKRLIDSELKNYKHKPVALAGVSASPWGGIRAIESMIPVVRELGMVAIGYDMMFPQVQNLFDEDGDLTEEKYRERIKKTINELLWMTKVLKWGRENV